MVGAMAAFFSRRLLFRPADYRRGMEAKKGEGDWGGAQVLAQEAVRRFPKRDGVLAEALRVFEGAGDAEGLQRVLECIEALRKPSQASWMEGARVLQALGENERALGLLGCLQEQGEGWPRQWAWLTALQLLTRMGRQEDALRAAGAACLVGCTLPWDTVERALRGCSDRGLQDWLREWEGAAEEVTSGAGERSHVGGFPGPDSALHEGDPRTGPDPSPSVDLTKLTGWVRGLLGDEAASLACMGRAARMAHEVQHPDVPWNADTPPLPPAFWIIGAMKSGTTTLWELMVQHPRILSPMHKELHALSAHGLSLAWYREHFPRVQGPWLVGEASPGSYALDVAALAHEANPEGRWIFVGRDPVERALSHLRHNQATGQGGRTFDALLWKLDEMRELCAQPTPAALAGLQRIASGQTPGNAFVAMGCYELLLEPWRNAFSSDRRLELRLEDLARDPQATLDRVFEFLGLETIPIANDRWNLAPFAAGAEPPREVIEALQDFFTEVAALPRAARSEGGSGCGSAKSPDSGSDSSSESV